jgi:hypothetical protein
MRSGSASGRNGLPQRRHDEHIVAVEQRRQGRAQTVPVGLAGRAQAYHDLTRADMPAGPSFQSGPSQIGFRFLFVHRPGLLAQLPLMKPACHGGRQRRRRVEGLSVPTFLPAAHLIDERPLAGLRAHARPHEGQHRLHTTRGPVLLVRRRQTGPLGSPLALTEQQHQVRVARRRVEDWHGAVASDTARGSGRRTSG